MNNIINIISIFLLIFPFYAVITDFKYGKIKNYFIFPSIIISLILTFTIKGFYNKENIIALIIILLFGFLFYKNNKWGAGDGKYIILIGLNSLIISYLFGFSSNILNLLFINIFGLLLIYNIFYLIKNYENIKKIFFKKNIKNFGKIKINILNDYFIISFIYLFAQITNNYIGTQYNYIIIFLSIILILPYIIVLRNKILKYFIISLSIFLVILNKDYYSYFFILLIFYIFNYLQIFFDKIYETIDTKKIKLFELKSGNILTKKSIKKIKKDINLEFLETPLQGNEVFNIIKKYKKILNNKINKAPNITIYNEFKIGIIMYIAYFITIIYLLKK